jgi:putative redox protein
MTRTIEVSFPAGAKITTQIGDHTIVTDQPVTNGGENSAPSPFDLFLASLATCAGFYAAAFCQKRGISMQGFGLRMHCQKSEGSKLYDHIAFEVTLPPGFPEDQIKALSRSIDLCTVRQHILHSPAFEIQVQRG